MERVPVGSHFDFAMVYSLYNIENSTVKDVDLLDKVFMALQLLEDSALGGSGSRGCGQIQFLLNEPVIRKVEDYESGNKPPRQSNSQIKLNNYKEEITKLKKALGAL